MSELPRMYHNKIDKDLNNNERVFSTLDSNNIYTNSFINNRNNLTVEQKIVNIFKRADAKFFFKNFSEVCIAYTA